MARATLATIITRLRALIGDDGATAVLSDGDLQAILDHNRGVSRYRELTAEVSYVNSVATYLTYHAHATDWEDGAALVDGDYTALTPDTTDLIAGRFTFAATTEPPVYISGNHFDIYNAAADALEIWAAKVAVQFDFSADGSSFSRSQQVDNLLAAAERMRGLAPARVGTLVRTDDAIHTTSSESTFDVD